MLEHAEMRKNAPKCASRNARACRQGPIRRETVLAACWWKPLRLNLKKTNLLFGEVCRSKGPAIVLRGHGLAVGAGTADGNDVSAVALVQKNVFPKDIGTLAAGTHYVIGQFGTVRGEVLDTVYGVVHGRAHQIVHAGVHNGSASPMIPKAMCSAKR